MAQIGYCYGSEYQLLRFLGHHRHQLEKEIMNVLNESGEFNWLDFDYADSMKVLSGDSEKKGIGFLKEILPSETFDKIYKEYSSYQINRCDSWQNWDAIFTLNNTLYLVEAKAHVEELSSGHKKHGGESHKEILRYIKEQLQDSPVSEDWLCDYYQLANRLATTSLINKYTPAKMLYLYFTNGYSRRVVMKQGNIVEIQNLNASRQNFEKAIRNEMETLGISEKDFKNLVIPVFIDASPQIK